MHFHPLATTGIFLTFINHNCSYMHKNYEYEKANYSPYFPMRLFVKYPDTTCPAPAGGKQHLEIKVQLGNQHTRYHGRLCPGCESGQRYLLSPV